MYFQIGLSLSIGLIIYILLKVIFKFSYKTDSKALLFLTFILCITLAFSLIRMTSLIIAMINNDNYVAAVSNSGDKTVTKSNVDNIEKPSKDAVREDLLNYVYNEVPDLVELDDEIVLLLNDIIGENYISDEISYNKLKDEIIPLSLDILDKAEKISPQTEEILNVHNILVLGIKERNAAFHQIMTAIENLDEDQVLAANDRIELAEEYGLNYREKLNELASKYDVDFYFED